MQQLCQSGCGWPLMRSAGGSISIRSRDRPPPVRWVLNNETDNASGRQNEHRAGGGLIDGLAPPGHFYCRSLVCELFKCPQPVN